MYIATLLRRMLDRYLAQQQLRRDLQQLAEMDDRMLADIGLDRSSLAAMLKPAPKSTEAAAPRPPALGAGLPLHA